MTTKNKKSNKKKVEPIEETKSEFITVTNSYIMNLLDPNNTLFQELVKKELPVKVSYWITRAITKMTGFMVDFESERTKIAEKFAKRDDDDEIIKVKGEDGRESLQIDNLEDFNVKFMELLNIEVDLGIKPIKYDVDNDNCMLSIQEMMLLMPLLEEIEE